MGVVLMSKRDPHWTGSINALRMPKPFSRFQTKPHSGIATPILVRGRSSTGERLIHQEVGKFNSARLHQGSFTNAISCLTSAAASPAHRVQGR
jgi:hypothetical protein